MNDKNITCQIQRSERPCLICSGYMDLIVARPPRFNLFGGMPFVCSSEDVDCLDCPKCGFKTTTVDYQYLSMCKKDEKGRFLNSLSDRRNSDRTKGRRRRESSVTFSSSASKGRNCSSCQAPLESSTWQFCPKCGNKCSSPNAAPTSPTALESVNEGLAHEIPKDIIITDGNSTCNTDSQTTKPTDSKSADSGIVRTVTPPLRTIANIDYLGPVEMQY